MAIIDLSRPDPNRNRRNGLITALVMIIYLLIIVKCSAQPCIHRIRPFFNSDSTRFIACDGLAFGVTKEDNTEDVIQMGILIDSLSNSNYSAVIFVWFPKSSYKIISTAEIDFGFKGVGIETLKFTFINRNVKYAEYRLTKEQTELFKNNVYEYVNFRINHNNLTYTEDWVEDPLISNFLKMF